jgi:hypothetical protein
MQRVPKYFLSGSGCIESEPTLFSILCNGFRNTFNRVQPHCCPSLKSPLEMQRVPKSFQSGSGGKIF